MLHLVKLTGALQALTDRTPAAERMRSMQLKQLRIAYTQAGSHHDALLERARRDQRTITWNVGLPLTVLGPGVGVTPLHVPYATAAADGSNLDIDPHLNPDYYVLNVGAVQIAYGPGAFASIKSEPRLFADAADLLVGSGGTQRPKTGRDIALERDLLEIEELARVAALLPADRPRVALVDGSLIHWDIEASEESIRDAFLERYTAALTSLRQQGIPVAGYIAAPQSRELVNALRLQLCTYVQSACASCDAVPCKDASGITDAEFLGTMLRPGERGPILRSTSRLFERIREQTVLSAMLHLGNAIVRVEFPTWVYEQQHLDTVLGVILDQAQKGAGYPPALQEAHEAAVITTSDRSALRAWVERTTQRRGSSAKASSKRMKRV